MTVAGDDAKGDGPAGARNDSAKVTPGAHGKKIAGLTKITFRNQDITGVGCHDAWAARGGRAAIGFKIMKCQTAYDAAPGVSLKKQSVLGAKWIRGAKAIEGDFRRANETGRAAPVDEDWFTNAGQQRLERDSPSHSKVDFRRRH